MWPMPTFCCVVIFVPVLSPHRAISGSREMRYFTSVSSCKLERSSLHFSFEKLSPVFTRMWKSWKSETANCSYVLPVFAPIHLPEATGICKWGKDKKSDNKRPGLKESSHERALLRKEKKSKPNWKHPKSVWSWKMLQLERGTTVEQRCATVPEGGGKENGGGHERWKKSTVAAHFVFFHLWKSFQMMQTVSAAAGCGGSRKKPGPVWLLLRDSKWFRAILYHD